MGFAEVLSQFADPVDVKIRMVAIDLDGTLLDDRKDIAPHVVESLRAVASTGVHVVIASARPPRSVRPIYNRLGLTTWQINYNGALVWDEPNQKVIAHRPIDGGIVRQIAEYARERFESVAVSCEVVDKWYTDRVQKKFLTETAKLFRRPDVVAPLSEICNQPITKLLLMGEPDDLLLLEADITREFGQFVTIIRTEGELLQIMDNRVSKAVAVRALAKRYGVPIEQVMAIGDAPNDVGMVQIAGVGVAMDNAHPVVKSAASWVAPSNNDHGVYAALRRYGLV